MSDEKTFIKSVLGKTELFQIFDDRQLDEISEYSELVKYDVNLPVCEYSDENKFIPLMVVASGCIGVIYQTVHKNTGDVINALIMPYQIFGEFQFLGDRFPENIKLKSFSKSSVVSIDSEYLKKLVEDNVKFYETLAKTLVEKLNINNFHVFIRNFSNSFRKKLCIYLYNVGTHPVWKRSLTGATSNKYKIQIYWTTTTLGQYLSTKERSIGEQLAALSEVRAIEIVWYDEKLKKLKEIKAEDIKNIGKDEAKLRFNTPFQITVLDRNNLRGLYDK